MAGRRLKLWIPGDPVAKGRGRAVRTAKGARVFTPTKTVRWEDWIAFTAGLALVDGAIPFDGPVKLWVTVVVRRPTSRPKKYLWPDKRPDLDNYLKAVLDGIQKAGLWRDDAQVCDLNASKIYASPEGRPGIRIVIEAIA